MPENFPTLRLAALADEIVKHVASPRDEVLDQLLKHAHAAATKHRSAIRRLAFRIVEERPSDEHVGIAIAEIAIPDGDLLAFTNGTVSSDSRVTQDVYEAWRACHNATWPVPNQFWPSNGSRPTPHKGKPGRKKGDELYNDRAFLAEVRRLRAAGEANSWDAAAKLIFHRLSPDEQTAVAASETAFIKRMGVKRRRQDKDKEESKTS